MRSFIVLEPGATSPAELLAAAIRAADVGAVEDLLPSLPPPLGGFGLLQAACCGQRDILELLLDHATGLGDLAPSPPSPPPPPADARGRQPLHFAAAHGDYGAAQLLLARGADVNAATREGATPLHHACAGGHRSVAELLLEQGAEVDCRAADGSTCLLAAAEAGHSHVVKALLRRGADPNAADAHGLTPLAAALVDGHRRCAEALLAASAAPPPRAVHYAAHHGMARVLSKLLEGPAAAEINEADETGETPLLAAARRGNQECVELLLAAGAAADSANRGGLTPLMAASLFCHETVAAALLARGAGVSARDLTHRRTPLHWAAVADAAGVARRLLDSGADVAAVDVQGATAEDLAEEYESTLVIQVFRSRGQR
ncbi:ankyrin repeat [Micractinium conductrix]|uniref:Ankyrin repeat n=1 Tax=Micractinium conductrix TaxID=554055 RepID=A0A2P6VG93_9CHLO|nr:ankyrin repeat [Micractinium conductrix]|eukprot:PSC73091.1 ankyrin repeat [Micractinium conductrix]